VVFLIRDEESFLVLNFESRSDFSDAHVPLGVISLLSFVWECYELELKEIFKDGIFELIRFVAILPDLLETSSQFAYIVGKVVVVFVEISDDDDDSLLGLITEELEVDFEDGLE